MENNTSNIKPYYAIDFIIDGDDGFIDLSLNLRRITILANQDMPQHVVVIDFSIDVNQLLTEDLFGQNDITLMIHLMTEDKTAIETMQLDLILIDSNLPLYMKQKTIAEGHPTEASIKMLCVIKDSFFSMNTKINKFYDESKRMTSIAIIKDLIKNFLPEMGVDIRTNNQIQTPAPQLLFERMSFIAAVRYIDTAYSIYSGPAFYWCDHDNVFHMWDFSEVISSVTPEYIVYHLAQGADMDIMKEAGSSNNIFYTYDLSEIYTGNQKTVGLGGKIYIPNTKPMDSLFSRFEFDTKELYKNSTPCTDREGDMRVHDNILGMTSTMDIDCLADNTEIYKSRITKKLANLSQIKFSLNRNLHLEKLLKIGVPIELRPQAIAYTDLQGKYVVQSSSISLDRISGQMWECSATIKAFRSNLKI